MKDPQVIAGPAASERRMHNHQPRRAIIIANALPATYGGHSIGGHAARDNFSKQLVDRFPYIITIAYGTGTLAGFADATGGVSDGLMPRLSWHHASRQSSLVQSLLNLYCLLTTRGDQAPT